MRTKFIKVLSLVLIVSMMITTIPPASAENLNSSSQSDNSNGDLVNDISVTGTNSFGKMFSETYYENYSQEETTGYGVYSVEFTENVATVTFDTLQTATIVVGLFDENNHSSMIVSEEIEVSKDETSTQITFNTDQMPEYFYIKAYLVDSETFRPLSAEYTSPMYTSDMQYLEQLSTTDFPEEQVLNLDDDTENNFAIYNSSVKVISENEETNIVSTVDDTNGIYVFENIDTSISSLQVGDTFSYAYGDDGLIIAKISEITIDGTTATITSDELEMEQVFDYVKIDVAPTISEAEIGTEELPEGVEYNGLVSDKTITSGGVVSSGGSFSADLLSYELKDVQLGNQGFLKYCFLNGSVKLELTPGVELKLTSENKYFEFKIDYCFEYGISISTKKDIISSTDSEKDEDPQPIHVISFGYIKFTHISGVSIKITPGLAISVSGEISLTGTLSGTVGFKISNSGFENLTTTPRLEVEIKVECTIFLGIDLNPEISLLADIASVGLDGVVGVEASGSIAKSFDTGELFLTEPSVHDCDVCIKGELTVKFTLSFNADIFNSEDLKYEADLLEIEFFKTDFYYSFDHQSFEFRKCPFQKHRITVTATDSSGEPIKFAYITIKDMNGELVKTSDINDYEITDENGKVSFYLQPGEYNISAIDNLGEYREVTKNLVVSNDAKSIYINLLTHDEILDDYYNQDNETPKQLSFGAWHSACVTENGDLYMWGDNQWGKLGNGTTKNQLTPIKIMSNVASVGLGSIHSACVTNDNELYTWGYNEDYQLGDGTAINRPNPVNVLSNIRTVSLGTCSSSAITKDNDLYTWGTDYYGILGNGTKVGAGEPEKIFDNVKMVSLGENHSAAITEDGDLYMWGYNNHGQIGVGDTKSTMYSSPEFIMSNVKYVSLGYYYSACITENGDLYMWGYNGTGCIGNGTTENVCSPELVMRKVKQVNLGHYHSACITENGDLYMWGDNYYGQLGDGTNENKLIPTKITTLTQKVKEIELGWGYTGAITESGEIYTWGYNSSGELGDGTRTDRNTPTKITLPTETSTASLSSSSNLNSILSSVSNTTNVVASGTGTSSAQSFEGLMPNEIYNFYAMKSKNVSEPLSSENLLYISQAISDENGNLSIDYDMTKDYENAVCFVVPMKQTDLSSATVTMDNLTYTGEEQFIHPTVTLDGVTLTEGKDYELCNYYYAQNVGEYSVTIRGIGYYTGEVEFIYYVNGKLGDINLDGNLSVVDAILVLRHVINSDTLTEQELLSADVNKDGSVTVVDAILIQKAVINVTNT